MSSNLNTYSGPGPFSSSTKVYGFIPGPVFGALALASSAASAYHGYKRNRSIGWAIAWGVAGGLAPILTPAIALAQGFGDRKKGR